MGLRHRRAPIVGIGWNPEASTMFVPDRKDAEVINHALTTVHENSNNRASDEDSLRASRLLRCIFGQRLDEPWPEPIEFSRNDVPFIVNSIVRTTNPDLAETPETIRAETLIGALLFRSQALSENLVVRSK